MSPVTANDKLLECRKNIDRIDLQLVALLNERARIAEQIGEVKRHHTLPVYEPKREEEVIGNALAHNHGPLPAESVRRVFEQIMIEMRMIQQARMES